MHRPAPYAPPALQLRVFAVRSEAKLDRLEAHLRLARRHRRRVAWFQATPHREGDSIHGPRPAEPRTAPRPFRLGGGVRP